MLLRKTKQKYFMATVNKVLPNEYCTEHKYHNGMELNAHVVIRHYSPQALKTQMPDTYWESLRLAQVTESAAVYFVDCTYENNNDEGWTYHGDYYAVLNSDGVYILFTATGRVGTLETYTEVLNLLITRR